MSDVFKVYIILIFHLVFVILIQGLWKGRLGITLVLLEKDGDKFQLGEAIPWSDDMANNTYKGTSNLIQ